MYILEIRGIESEWTDAGRPAHCMPPAGGVKGGKNLPGRVGRRRAREAPALRVLPFLPWRRSPGGISGIQGRHLCFLLVISKTGTSLGAWRT